MRREPDHPPGLYGLLGRNGAGKTTLMRTVATLLPCAEGRVTVNGVPVTQAARVRAMVGYLPQDFAAYPQLTVREALGYFGTLSGLDARRLQARGLRDCVAARRVPYLFCCALRAVWPTLAAALLMALYTLVLRLRGCAAGPELAFAGFANALFLGGLALLSATVLGGAAAGAVPPLGWLLLDSLTARLGAFSLLRRATGTGMPKPCVLAAALALFAAAFGVRYRQLRRG